MRLPEQHTAETGPRFEPEAEDLAWELTRGQPWLVNALARQITEEDVRDRGKTITAAHVEKAKEALIERRDTRLDSLVDRLREDRVRRVIEPILAGEHLLGDRLHEDAAFVEDLGLVERRNRGHMDIANPIYREVIPRVLADNSARGPTFYTRLALLSPPEPPSVGHFRLLHHPWQSRTASK